MFQGMEYVYKVYKEKSFSKAAANLFYFPAFSQRQCQACGVPDRLSGV